jgi:hypothetical protein
MTLLGYGERNYGRMDKYNIWERNKGERRRRDKEIEEQNNRGGGTVSRKKKDSNGNRRDKYKG